MFLKNKLIINSYLVTLMLLFALTNYAQKVTIVDLQTNYPIENVNVYNKDKSKVEVTGKNGTVTLKGFNFSELIYVSHSSYQTEKLTLADLIDKDFTIKMVNEKILKEVIINPLREDVLESIQTNRIEQITEQETQFSNPATTADMLQQNAGVLVQKSQAGGGSPVIRGFEANKILLVLDGVRLNNAIYRGGHLQNAITVDNNILKNTDVFYGPGSVVYGSDALGGVIHFHTKTPNPTQDDSLQIKANALVRYASASNEKTGHADVEFVNKKWGSLTSFTYTDFDDLRMGKNRLHGYDDFGKIFNYVQTNNNVDSVLINPDVNVHKRTGYNQIDVLQKVVFAPNKYVKLIGNFQYSTSSNINRFDKLNEYRNGQLRFAEWYYGPQNRLLGSLKLALKGKKELFDFGNIILAYQKIDEDRISRRLYDSQRRTREEDVSVYSINADFSKNLSSKHRFYYGAEFTYNDVQSSAYNQDINTLSISNESTRYPDGGSSISTMAVYLSYSREINKKLNFNIGGRYSHFTNKSSFIDTTFVSLPFDEIRFNTGSLIGSLGLTFKDESGLSIEGILSTGFRSPNVDDYGKVFENDGFVVVPNKNLRPENIFNGELNLTKKWIKDEKQVVRIHATAYYSMLTNAIIRRNFSLNGQDSLLYDGETARIQANQNVSLASVYGGVLGGAINFTSYLRLRGSVTYTKGRDLTNNEPASHIPPLFGTVGLGFATPKFHVELSNQFNGKKDISEYASGSVDKPSEATVDGTPAWNIFTFRSSYQLTDNVKVQLNVENILDTHYKQFASGISGAGRNIIISVRSNF